MPGARRSDADSVARGRELVARRAWVEAHATLAAADRDSVLGGSDLDLLAEAAYMLAEDDEYLGLLERAHAAHLAAGEPLRAVRSAFWLGLGLILRGEAGRAAGWFGRARRLVDREGVHCVERGYLLLPDLLQRVAAGDLRGAEAVAAESAAIGERYGDRDLFALAVQEQGHALVRQGRVEEGLRLVDEAMVAVTAGELSPIVTGLVYCNTIAFCQRVYELHRAREWTAALTRWCAEQPGMVTHTGLCLLHRAEILELEGAWPEALEEARRAGERLGDRTGNRRAVGQARYREGEIHRLRGRLAVAEAEYREASRCGCEPQPGLALLRLAQRNGPAAAAAIRRVLGETAEPLARARLLAACVEIMLALGETAEAGEACRELEAISAGRATAALGAMAATARGAVALAEGDATEALRALRPASDAWRELGAPYEDARARTLMGLACRALGDEDAAAMELEAAREVFASLEAAPDQARVEALASRPAGGSHGLTAREIEVLRMVAAGATNRAIAAELVISERTVDRHVSNILTKLRAPSRAAATAYAYEHRLV